MAFEDVSKFLELVLVIGHELAGGIVTLVLHRDDLHAEFRSRDVHVRTLLVTRVVFLLLARAGIDRKPGVANVRILVHVDAAEWRVDVHILILSIVVFLNANAACSCDYDHDHRREKT